MFKQLSLFFAFLLILKGSLSASTNEFQKPLHLVMHERDFTLSTYYNIDSEDCAIGNIVKTRLSLRTSYEFYSPNGLLGSTAYLRIFSLGSLFTWAGVMDVYDAYGDRVGLIEGAILTLLPSKFYFYDADNSLVGIAYMDHDCMGFTITDPNNEFKSIAHLHRIFVRDVVDHWTISIFDHSAIDHRLIYSFGAFAIDNQAGFREDN